MVNGITSVNTQAATYESNKLIRENSKKNYSESAVYEKSSTAGNTKTIMKLKSDLNERTEQLKDLVQKMMLKQGSSISSEDNMWKKLSSGGFIADSEAIEKAKDDISENGYWGANQTSDRILSFASALADNNPEKMQKMLDAFEKGYNLATKNWGKDLPELCQNTYKMVHDKFDNWFNSNKITE